MLHLETEAAFNIDQFMMEKVFAKKDLANAFEKLSIHLRHKDAIQVEIEDTIQEEI
jgi:hypothetical protein